MTELNYSVLFPFEKNFDEQSFHKWMQENWCQCFWFSGLYVVVIFGSKYYMEKRQRFEIRELLALWSAILAAFSIFGAARTIPEFVHALTQHGFHYSVCSPSFFSGPTAFWAAVFAISKVYELGDTVFIVLRKQQLIFLHWYHHITVLIYAWMCYLEHTGPGRWFMVMNYTVHSFMYTYYALKALRFNIPRQVNVVITAMQLMQMVIGTGINIWTYHLKSQGKDCQQSYRNLHYSLLMYSSYFVLFSIFFYNTYIKPKPKSKSVKAE